MEQIVAAGESETAEFKKSTAQLPRVGETLCVFLNGQGGHVFIGITAEGRVVGQRVSDGTLREVAAMLARFKGTDKAEFLDNRRRRPGFWLRDCG